MSNGQQVKTHEMQVTAELTEDDSETVVANKSQAGN